MIAEKLTPEREAEIRARPRTWVPLNEWGPKCAGCGGGEYRIDGFCSRECRDYHCDNDVIDLLTEIDRIRTESKPCARSDS